jgi:hypothetical protein
MERKLDKKKERNTKDITANTMLKNNKCHLHVYVHVAADERN